MSVGTSIALFAAGTLFSLLVVVLAVPFRFAFHGEFSDRRVDASAKIDWGWGLVRAEADPEGGLVIRVGRWQVWHPRPSPPQDETDRPAKKVGPSWRRPSLRFVRRVLQRLIRSLHLEARLCGTIGTGDPAETARVFGALAATRALLPGVDTHELRVDWLEPVVDLEGHVSGRVLPAAIVWIAATEFARERLPRRITTRRST